jgi:putative ABC transport system permease protein
VEFVLVIAVLGAAFGMLAGWWLGTELAQLYARFFRFPHLLFSRDPAVYGLSALLSLAAAVAGALKSAMQAASLSPAVAMSPPSPPRYRKLLRGAVEIGPIVGQAAVMNIRHLAHWPWRTAGGILGVGLAVAILVGSLWSFGSVRYIIDVTFNRSERQDASIQFPAALPMSALHAVARMPGVLQAEPFRAVATEASFGSLKRRVVLMGKLQGAELSRMLDERLRVVTMPEKGLVISSALAKALGARRGDVLRFRVFEGRRQTIALPVSAIVEGYFGLGAYMEMGELNAAMQEGAMVSGVNLTLDDNQQQDWFAQLKRTPATRFVALQKTAERKFKETLAENLSIMMTVYVVFGAIIAFGVIYNFARISLSEQGREMASLRVLGFTRAEVSSLLIAEIAIVVLAAQPVGWLVGYGFAHLMVRGFSTELYRVPAIIEADVYAYASLTVMAAAAISVFIVRRRIDRLDMIAVLKTRE